MKQNAVPWLWKTPGKKRIIILFLAILEITSGLSSVLYALLLRNIVDSAVDKNTALFWHAVLLTCLLVVGQIGLRALIRRLDEYTRSTLENAFKKRLLENILRRDYAAVSAIHSAEWSNRLTNDTVVVANGLTDILPGLAGMAAKMLGALIMIIALDRRLAAVLLPAGALLMALTFLFRKVLKRLHKRQQEADGRLRIFLQERLGSLMIIRSYAAEDRTEDEADEKMGDHKAARMRRNRFSNLCNIGFSAAMNGMYLFGVCYCGYGILTGAISYGTLTAITQLIAQVQAPLANITGFLPRFYAMTASAERLMEIETFPQTQTDVLEADEIRRYYEDDFESLSLSHADFTYYPTGDNAVTLSKDNMPVVLSDVSLTIRKGEYAAFTGHSGCGKSTILKLVMCIYALDGGERFLTGRHSGRMELTARWHRLFAYVPQGNYLMSGTIREIISFADKSGMYDDERIARALRIACADDFVDALDQGVDTLLGERGTGLSEGQMQRVAIARAIFSDCPILLLDESTSALDENTERRLLQNLKDMTDKTVVIVTHRKAVLGICDKRVTFTENGILTEELPHA